MGKKSKGKEKEKEKEKEKMIIPDDVKKELKKFCKNHGIKLNSLKDQFREIYFNQCADLPAMDGTRARSTKNALKAIINTSAGGKSIDGIVLNVGAPDQVVVKKGQKDESVSDRTNITGIFDVDNKKRVINLTAWNAAIASAKKIPKNSIVRLSGIFEKTSKEYGKQYTFNESSTFQVIQEIDVLDFVKKKFRKKFVSVEEFEMKPSKNNNDKKFVMARIKDTGIIVTRKGNLRTTFKVYDDRVSDIDLKENPEDHLISMMGDVGLAKLQPGSLCIFIGNITKATEQYSATMFLDAVVPVTSFEKSDEEYESVVENAKERAKYFAKKNKEDEGTDDKDYDEETDDIDEVAEDVDLSNW